MHDLLMEPRLPAGVDGREVRLSLPGVLARLSVGDIDAFPGLAAHQRQAWFHFLVQLGAVALDRNGCDTPPEDEDAWRGLLAALTPGAADTAWSLVAEDPERPRSEEHTSELQSLMRISYAVFCLKK